MECVTVTAYDWVYAKGYEKACARATEYEKGYGLGYVTVYGSEYAMACDSGCVKAYEKVCD